MFWPMGGLKLQKNISVTSLLPKLLVRRTSNQPACFSVREVLKATASKNTVVEERNCPIMSLAPIVTVRIRGNRV